MMLSHVHGEIIIEAFELSSTNAATMETTGRLRRIFPDVSNSIGASEFVDIELREMLARSIATLSHQVFPGMMPQTQKAGQAQVEIRDTVHPHAVTEMLMSVVQAIGKSVTSNCIKKNTRDEVLWKDCLSPWRRSPFWLLIRTGLQLLCTRLHPDRDTGNLVYKTIMIYFQAELLERRPSMTATDNVHVMIAKLSRRLLKLQNNKSHFNATALWYETVKRVISNASQELQGRWNRCIELSKPDWSLEDLKSLDFTADTQLTLPELDAFLARVTSRQTETRPSAFDPTEIVLRLHSDELPEVHSVDLSVEHGLHQLAAFHEWVESSLPGWLSSHLHDPTTCPKLWQLMAAYNRNASDRIGTNPEMHSLRILTVMELWVACDASACAMIPLLREYQPEIPLSPLESLLLPKKAQMIRLNRVEQYVEHRRRSAISGLPGIFGSFGRQLSFGVRYYQSSSSHQNLQHQIDQNAQATRQQKIEEFQSKRSDYLRLVAQADDMDCDVETVTIDEFNGIDEERHPTWCKKCRTARQANAIDIKVDEWPLPRGFEGQAIVFELDVPLSFGTWRECTAFIVHDVLKYEHFGGHRPKNQYTAASYENLENHFSQNLGSSQRIMAVSEDKPFLVSHYKAIRVSNASQADVCKENAMHYRYCDMDRNIFIKDVSRTDKLAEVCSYKLTEPSKALRRFLSRPPSKANGVPHNEVIASQSSCPATLPLKEFRACATLPYGQRIQWMNILRELAAPTIDFSKPDTCIMILHVINQAGSPLGQSIERTSHALLANEEFCLQVMRLLEDSRRTVEENWESADALATFVHIASRLYSFAPSEQVQRACLTFLKSARSVSLGWMQLLQRKVFMSTADDERMQFTLAAVETALICSSTFDVDQASLDILLRSDQSMSAFLQCAMAIQENHAALEHSKHPLQIVMLHRWQILTFRAWPSLQTQIIDHANRGLDLAIKSSWPDYHRGETWVTHEQCKHWMITSTAAQEGHDALKVHFDLLKGELLVNGTPLARLPSEFEAHPSYRILFGASQIQVRPSAMCGMDFAAKQEYAGHAIDFGMLGAGADSDMFVNATNNETRTEFIPAKYLAKDLPASFSEDYVHWFNDTSQIVEFRPKHDPWNTSSSYRLERCGKGWILQKVDFMLVSPASRTAMVLCKILSTLEKSSRVHLSYQASEDSLRVELPRLRLSFSLRRNTTELVSRDFRGMCVDCDQNVGCLIGLESKLVLRNIHRYGHRRLLVPNGQVMYHQDQQHVKVIIDDTSRETIHEYQVDVTLQRLVDKGTIEGKLFLSYLHALTSSCSVDPLTGKTGTEQALSILSSASIRSFDRLTEDNMCILAQIAGISPQRSFYPQHLRGMQSIKWDKQLGPLAQHGRFHTVTQTIFAQWKSQQMFHPDSEVQSPWINSVSHLIERDLVRSSTFRVCGHGAEDFATKSDSEYTRRPNRHKAASRAFQASTLILKGSQQLANAFEYGLAERHWAKFAGASSMAGVSQPLQVMDLALSASWLDDPWAGLRSIWLRLHRSFSDTTTKANKFAFSMWLSSVTFAHEPLTEAVHTLIALYNSSGMPSIALPQAGFFYPATGTTVNKSNLSSIVHQAKRSVQTCASMWSKRSNEPDKQFRQRRKREFDQRQTAAANLFVTHLHQQWPEFPPTVPDISDVRQLIDTAAVIRNVTPLSQKWLDNRSLRYYLTDVETTLRQWSATTMPPFLRSSKTVFTPVSRMHVSVSADDLFSTSAPEVMTVPEKSHTLLPIESGPSSTVQTLESLLQRLEGASEVLYVEEYVKQLRESKLSLHSRKDKHIPIYNLEQMEHDLLKHNGVCSKLVQEALMSMISAGALHMNETSSLAWTIGLRPRVGPTFFLSQLVSTRHSELTANWRRCIITYACLLVELHRLRRLIIVHRSHADFLEELVNIPHQTWDPSEYPQYLLLEVESGLVIRSVQEEIAREMKNAGPQNAVMQLNMGEGKSSVILPMVASDLANGSQLVRIIVPKPQARQLFQMLTSKLGGLLGKRIYHLPISRSLKLSAAEAEQVIAICNDCMKVGGILLVQPEHILSLKLMALDLLASGKEDAGKSILKVLHLFDTKARDIVDESDENFSVKFELVYTMGLQNPIDFSPDRWRITLAVLQMLPKCARQARQEFPSGIEIEDGAQTRFPRLRFLQADASARTMDFLADELCEIGLHGLPVAGMTSRARNLIRQYIREIEPSDEALNFVNGGELTDSYDEVVKRTMLLLRGLIAKGVLNFAFGSKRWRVNYGPDPSRRPETKLAVPYRAKDCPSSRSEFSHPDVVIVLTSIHYFYAFLSDDELFLCLEHVLRSDQAPAEYAAWTQTSPTLPLAFRELIGINIKDRQQCVELMFPHLRQATGVINYYLQHIVFPKEMREFQHKMSASGWDIAEKKALTTTGFSGTNDSRYVLPLSVRQLDLSSQQHTNALVLSYLLQPESQVHLLAPKSSASSDAEHLLRCIINGTHKIRVVLDVGAQILELNNLQVAQLWLSLMTDADGTKAAIFVDDKDEICVVDRQGHVEPLQSSPYSGQVDLCLVYLDEAHTRGIDLRLPRDYRAAVTLGASLTKDRLVQGKTMPACKHEKIANYE